MTDTALLECTAARLQQAQQLCVKATRDLSAEFASLSNKAAELAAEFSLAAATTAAIEGHRQVTHQHAWSFAGAFSCLARTMADMQDHVSRASQDALALHGLVAKAERCTLEWERVHARAKQAMGSRDGSGRLP
jgi:hypothetical protein